MSTATTKGSKLVNRFSTVVLKPSSMGMPSESYKPGDFIGSELGYTGFVATDIIYGLHLVYLVHQKVRVKLFL